MLRLMLLRHAKSDWSATGTSDHERKLNARGRAAAPVMGRYLIQEQLLPSFVICSTAERTRETCDLVMAEFSKPPPIHYERRLYEASPETIIKIIAATPDDVHTLLVIGHNPGLQLTALMLATRAHAKQREKLREKFPTAALAVIDFDAKAWTGILPAGGALERLVTPRDVSDTD
jgi:phosphohistidine phosphatase